MGLLWWPWFGIGGAAPPVVAEYRPVGGPLPRGKRKKIEIDQELDEEAIVAILSNL